MSVRISWIIWPAEMMVMAGDMNAPRKPWKPRIMPRENFPCIESHTPKISTEASAMSESRTGIMPRYWFTLAYLTLWALTEAW